MKHSFKSQMHLISKALAYTAFGYISPKKPSLIPVSTFDKNSLMSRSIVKVGIAG